MRLFGFANAQFMLGIKLARGEGLPRDTAESLAWLQVAAWNGQEEAARRFAMGQGALDAGTSEKVQRRAREIAAAIAGRKQ